MKKYFGTMALIATFYFACNSSSPTAIPDDFGSPDDEVIVYVGQQKDNGVYPVVVKNQSGESMYYTGSSKDYPFFIQDVKVDTGWVMNIGWCGTGAIQCELKDGKELAFEVGPLNQPNVTWRTGIYLRAKGGESKPYYSEPIHSN